MYKDEIVKLILKYSAVLEEICGDIEVVDNLYYLKTKNKVFEFRTLGDLEKLLSLYYKKYILTKGKIFNL